MNDSIYRPKIIVESPFAAETIRGAQRNLHYARAAVRDSILRGEAPFASHLLYAQEGILDDADAEQRRLGIETGLAWYDVATACAVYIDFGITQGMQQGLVRARAQGLPIYERKLDWDDYRKDPHQGNLWR